MAKGQARGHVVAKGRARGHVVAKDRVELNELVAAKGCEPSSLTKCFAKDKGYFGIIEIVWWSLGFLKIWVRSDVFDNQGPHKSPSHQRSCLTTSTGHGSRG